jgi:hypothetical protein
LEKITHINKINNHPEWNESYYLAFYDIKNKIGGVSRLGFKPNKQEGMTFFFLFLPDGSVAGYHIVKKIKDYSKSLRVKSMIHKCYPDAKWSYQFNDKMIFVKNSEDLPKVRENPNLISSIEHVHMELNFNPVNEIYEYSKHMTKNSLELGKKAGDKHWEQIALISGEIKIAEKTYIIKSSLGQRDHTYGVRDWTGVGNWFYYVVWFNENLAINPAAVIAEDGRLSTGGFLFKEGKNIPLKHITILKQNFRKDGILPISSELELIDFFDNKHIFKAKVGKIIPIEFKDNEENQSILIQSFGDFDLDGIKGYGTFETLRKVKKI